MKGRVSAIVLALMPALLCGPGCVIDDRGDGTRGGPPPAAPTASVPDAGGPLRRESAAETLNDAGPSAAPGGGLLDVAPAGGPRPTPPPPVR
jgi:hypothetical protein